MIKINKEPHLARLRRMAETYEKRQARADRDREARDRQCLNAYNHGATYVEIGGVIGTTKHRVTQILAQQRKRVIEESKEAESA